MSGSKTFPDPLGTGELQFQGKEVHRLLINAQKPGWHSKQLGGGGVFAETSQTSLHSHTPAQAKAKSDKKRSQTGGTSASQGCFLQGSKRKSSGLKVKSYSGSEYGFGKLCVGSNFAVLSEQKLPVPPEEQGG